MSSGLVMQIPARRASLHASNPTSRSTRDLSKAIVAAVVKQQVPIPEELLQQIQSYIEKHADRDEAYYNRLLEDLFAIYLSNVHGKPGRLAPFLAVLRGLNPLVVGYRRLLQWWDKFSKPMLAQLVDEKGLATDVRETVLDWLLWDDESGGGEQCHETAALVTERITETWLERWHASMVEFDEDAKFLENQLQLLLIAYGRKRPQHLLAAVDKFLWKAESRIGALTLLCEFVRQQPPHLHQVLQTRLFENLLRCLQSDTSTRVISLAMTAVIMFLPHIPNDLPPHLPALFNIYSRMLFWDRERRSELLRVDETNDKSEVSSVKSDHSKSTWIKLPAMLESEDDSVPELLHLFTFLYGLYPLNFMSFIRKPQRYVQNTGIAGVEDLDIEAQDIQSRSERFRQMHLLHPNMFTSTVDSELSDTNRWLRSEAADVVADCMGLYIPIEDVEPLPITRKRSSTASMAREHLEAAEDALLSQEDVTVTDRHASWRHTGSTAVASPDEDRPATLFRNASQSSRSLASRANSPSMRMIDRHDSPTIPPDTASSGSHSRLEEMLPTRRSARGSLFDHTNDSNHSLAHSHHMDGHASVESYLQLMGRDSASSSSFKKILPDGDPATKIAYLHREIVLLRNDLNFERYLKRQHLSHISKLRRKQIHEARVEAETQNLLNSNRTLKSKLEESRRANLQLRKENEKSRANSRKWEASLTTKLKAFKEEAKTWTAEGDQLRRELESTKADYIALRTLVVDAEQRELFAIQRANDIERRLKEVDDLKAEVAKVTAELAVYQEAEERALTERDSEAETMRRIEMLNTRLRTRDEEMARLRQALDEATPTRIESDGTNNRDRQNKADTSSKEMLEHTIHASQARIAEMQKARNHLLKRYGALQNEHLDLHEKYAVLRQRYSKLGGIIEDDDVLGDHGGMPGSSSATRSPIEPPPRSKNGVLGGFGSFLTGGGGAGSKGTKEAAHKREEIKRAETFAGVYNATSPLGAPGGREDFSVHKQKSHAASAGGGDATMGKAPADNRHGEKPGAVEKASSGLASLGFHSFAKMGKSVSSNANASANVDVANVPGSSTGDVATEEAGVTGHGSSSSAAALTPAHNSPPKRDKDKDRDRDVKDKDGKDVSKKEKKKTHEGKKYASKYMVGFDFS